MLITRTKFNPSLFKIIPHESVIGLLKLYIIEFKFPPNSLIKNSTAWRLELKVVNEYIVCFAFEYNELLIFWSSLGEWLEKLYFQMTLFWIKRNSHFDTWLICSINCIDREFSHEFLNTFPLKNINKILNINILQSDNQRKAPQS